MTARLLAGLVAASVAAGIGVILMIAVWSVQQTRFSVAQQEARMSASLWEFVDDGESAIAEWTEGRATLLDGEIVPGPTGAHAFNQGSLRPAATVDVTPIPSSGAPTLAMIIGVLGVVLFVGWAWKTNEATAGFSWAVACAAFASLALVTVLAARWAGSELRLLSTHHTAQGARAVEIALASNLDEPVAASIAGIPWVNIDAIARGDEIWTIPTDVLDAQVDADWSQPIIEVGRVDYHVGFADRIRVVKLGYEETDSPALRMTTVLGGTVLVAGLLLFLLSVSGRTRLYHNTVAAWAFLSPSAVLLTLFTFGPLLFSFWLSLYEWRLVEAVHPFVMLDNYLNLLRDGAWWSSIWNTVLFTLHVPLAMMIALGLALITQGSHRAMRWARLALFLPSVTSVVAIAVVWKWLLNDGYGMINRIISAIGIGPIAWLTSPKVALLSLMIISVWMVVGYQMVVFQAGLASIPKDWHDAARVDGAGPLQRFWHITLPGLRHTLFFVFITSVIGSFQVFGLVYVITEGGPLDSTDVAVYHIYREAWVSLQFGNAAAMSWILFAVVFAFTWLHFRLVERRVANA